MIISNLKYSENHVFQGRNYSMISCVVDAKYTDNKELSFFVDPEYGDYLTDDVYDAFMVAMLYPAMYYNEPIEIDGYVSKKLYNNLTRYVEGIVSDFAPKTHKKIEIKVRGFKDAVKNHQLHIGTGFSGGVDSFSTLKDNFFDTDDPEYKIDTLFFFHVGQYGDVRNPKTWERAFNRFTITQQFAKEIGVNAVMMNTNLFDFYKPEWEYQAGVLNRIASVLVFQKSLKRYYISNAYTYGEMIDLARDRVFLEEFSDPYIMPLLSPHGLDIVCDGAQYRRTTKTQRIITIPLTRKYLNVCVNSSDAHVAAVNCSECGKCMRTMMALESLGSLDAYGTVFDISKYQKKQKQYKALQICKYNSDGFARDNVDFAREHGIKMPSLFIAHTRSFTKKCLTFPYRVARKVWHIIK